MRPRSLKWYALSKLIKHYRYANFDIYHIYRVRENHNFIIFLTLAQHSEFEPHLWHISAFLCEPQNARELGFLPRKPQFRNDASANLFRPIYPTLTTINLRPSGNYDGVFTDWVDEVEARHLSSSLRHPRRVLPASHIAIVVHTLNVLGVSPGWTKNKSNNMGPEG